jgi:hypothetical protein
VRLHWRSAMLMLKVGQSSFLFIYQFDLTFNLSIFEAICYVGERKSIALIIVFNVLVCLMLLFHFQTFIRFLGFKENSKKNDLHHIIKNNSIMLSASIILI